MRILLIFFLLLSYFSSEAQSGKYDEIRKQLEYIHILDQAGREKSDSVQKLYQGDSIQMMMHMKRVWDDIHIQDSINQIAVTKILDQHGWLGVKDIGEDANTTLFLVIQHADLAVQEKYLPMMRDAAKKGNAKPSALALLEDRVALRQGRKQIYGSQVGWDMIHNDYYVQPLEDPDNVDTRRSSVGLPPMSVYLAHWSMKWDVDQYKKDLPAIEKRFWNRQ